MLRLAEFPFESVLTQRPLWHQNFGNALRFTKEKDQTYLLMTAKSQTRRAFLKTPENFSGPKTFRGASRVFFSGPEKCFSKHPKLSRVASRYFRVSFRGGHRY